MGAATERAPEVVLEDGLRKRKEGSKSESADGIKPNPNVTPLSHAWKPSQRTQNITIWALLVVTTFFSIAVVIEELQASWYRSPAIYALDSQIYGAESLDSVLKLASQFDRSPETIRLQWNVTTGFRSPDGVKTNVHLINNEFTGPVIEAKPGDSVELDLINGLEGEDLTLQFDGLVESSRGMWGTKDAQKAIAPGAATSYEFQIPTDKSGTFMYRASSAKQASAGVFGAITVRDTDPEARKPNSNVTSAVDEERVLVLNEWYHQSANSDARNTPSSEYPNSILINGIGAFNCSQIDPAQHVDCISKSGRGRPNMKFDAGKTYRLRFINAGTTAGLTISIPGTIMTVIEVDGGQSVRPKRATTVGVLRPGQRVDVLVRWAAGGDDEITVSLDDDSATQSSDATFALTQSFPIRVSGFLNSRIQPPTPRYIDILRLSPLSS